MVNPHDSETWRWNITAVVHKPAEKAEFSMTACTLQNSGQVNRKGKNDSLRATFTTALHYKAHLLVGLIMAYTLHGIT